MLVCGHPRDRYILRNLPPNVTRDAAEAYDTLPAWALASIIAGDGAGAAALVIPVEVQTDHNICRR